MSKIFVDACFAKETPYTPVWMMRQAGRYLKEYRQVRKQAGDFLSLCHNPTLACEVTLQPMDILNVDAAILFSDILVIPNEMGMHLEFIKGEGPIFKAPVITQEALDHLRSAQETAQRLTYVYDTIKQIKQTLPQDKALIGFAGSPWTLATYMIEGQGSKTYNQCKKMIYANPTFLHNLLQKVCDSVKYYLEKQILSGADVIQIFDSWASAIEPSMYNEFSWSYMMQITDYLKEKYPHIPIILFPKGISPFLDDIYGNFDVLGVDWSTPLQLAKEKVGDQYVLQGNMEPCRLYNQNAITEYIQQAQQIMQGKRHIFNLGHGILPDIPVENAKHFITQCQQLSKK